MADIEKPQVIFVLGGPGSGKGTQCAKIVASHGYVHLSAGDLLRAERSAGTENSKLINDIIAEGNLVPTHITVGLIKAAMEQHVAKGKKNFLIDGYPRNQENKDGWDSVVGDSAVVRFCLYLETTEEVMTARLIERGKTSGRVDDNLEAIQKRFRTYAESTKPIIDMFTAEGKCVKVDSTKSREEVFAQIEPHL